MMRVLQSYKYEYTNETKMKKHNSFTPNATYFLVKDMPTA